MTQALDPLREEAERVRASGALGRSDLMRRLFDHLAAKGQAGEPVREIDLAVDVFEKRGDLDLSSDASVRVYVHRLRRRLDEHYREHVPSSGRLVIPPGEYRLALTAPVATEADEAASQPTGPAPPAPGPARRRERRVDARWGAMLLALLLFNLLAWVAVDRGWLRRDALADLRRTAFWAGAVDEDRPVLLVLGDYYLFGDTEGGGDVSRLIREFDVNSRAELDALIMSRPELNGRYVDLNLNYVPVGGAAALRRVAPVLTSRDGRRGARLVLASELTPAMIKNADIVYLGLISGMGLLQERVFAGSAFRVGDSFDELVDDRGRTFVSQSGRAFSPDTPHADYGYLASFTGPSGARLVVIAGMRDVGLMQAAEFATSPAGVRALEIEAGKADGAEALYRVQGLGRTNVAGKLVDARPRAVAPN
jgi:hypothetical protein